MQIYLNINRNSSPCLKKEYPCGAEYDTSAKIVRKAVEMQKAIALEKLSIPNESFNKEWSRRIANWVRGKMIKYIRYKAKLNGIPVIQVESSYTSKKCHICDENGKRFSSIFKCKVCGRIYDADFNASVNIAQRAKLLLSMGSVILPLSDDMDDGIKLPTFSRGVGYREF
jgi:IS605 OrfB family transposase